MTRSSMLIGSILVVSAMGAGRSVRRGRPAQFAGVRLPGSAAQHALTIGSPLSAPPLMVAGLAVAHRRGRDDIVAWIAAAMVVGIVGEPDSWTTLRHPMSDPITTLCVVSDIVLPALLVREVLGASA